MGSDADGDFKQKQIKIWSQTWLDSSVGRALHQYLRAHGFKSQSGLNFFQALISTTP